jgi:hypothetical protein
MPVGNGAYKSVFRSQHHGVLLSEASQDEAAANAHEQYLSFAAALETLVKK